MTEDTIAQPEVASPPRVRSQRVAGVLIAVPLMAIIAISNLDVLARSWYQEGSLLPSIFCYELFTSFESLLGVQNERLASAWNELANAYSKVPRYKDAIKAAEQSIQIRESLGVDYRPRVLMMKAHIGEYLYKDRRFAEADKILAEALKENEQSKQPEPISRGYILESQAKSFMEQKRWDEALTAASQLLPIDTELMEQKRLCFDGRELLAEIQAKSGNLPEAERLAKESIELKDKIKDDGAGTVSLALAHETLGKVLICSHQKDAAQREFKSAMTLLEKEYGSTSERVQYWRARYQHLLNEQDPFEK